MVTHPILKNHSENKIGSISEQLLAEVVHKIKNSLGGIGGFATLLERDFEPEDPRLRLVQRIEDGVLRLNDFVVYLMILVRIDEPTIEEVRLSGMAREVWENYMVEQNSLFNEESIKAVSPDKTVTFMGDGQLIRHMIYHAIRFTNAMGNELKSIDFDEGNPDKLIIRFQFQTSQFLTDYQDIERVLQQCEPVENKLSLAIVLKMATHYSGHVTLVESGIDMRTMQIHLEKGE